MLSKTNIESKLRDLRTRIAAEEAIMNEVRDILNREQHREADISEALSSGKDATANDLIFDKLDTDRVYHLDQIQKICVDYRLRFLSARYFKGAIPPEAVIRIKEMERTHQTVLKGYKILAPSKLFKLEDPDDPLLFVPIGNGYFYLVHKWGNDLHPFRKLLVLPFRNLSNLIVFTLLISWICTKMLPLGLFSPDKDPATFWLLFMFVFKMIGSIVIFYGFALGKNFNTQIWNSKYM